MSQNVEQKTLKNKLMDIYADKVLMEWDIFRYAEDESDSESKVVVEFAGRIVDEDFRKDTFSFFSQDDENYVWMFDPEQRLSSRNAEAEAENEVIVGGPTKVVFDTPAEAGEYMVYVVESLNAAAIYYATKVLPEGA